MLRRLAFALATLAVLAAAPARAADPDYSDIWWAAGGGESGWGVNFAHGCRHMDWYEGVWYYAPRSQRPLATMVLSTDAISVKMEGLRSIADGKLSLKGQIGNPGRSPVTLKGEVAIRTDDKVVLATPFHLVTVPPGATEAIAAEHSLSVPTCGDVALSITDQAGQPLLAYALPFVYSRQLSFKIRYYPTAARLEAVIDAGSSALLARITGAKVSIVRTGGTNVLRATTIPRFDGLQHEVRIDCGPLPIGSYDVLAEIKLGDTTVVLKEPLVKERPPEWLGNKLGTIHTVPKPWTPLIMTGRTVACWGREDTFGAKSDRSHVVL